KHKPEINRCRFETQRLGETESTLASSNHTDYAFAPDFSLFSRSTTMNSLRRLPILVSGLMLLSISAAAQGLDTAKIESALGRPGQMTGDVYRVGFPRTDLHVTVHGLAIRPGLALGSWAAFMGTDDRAMVMGDLVLLDEELTPVMQKLTSSGFEVS